MNSPLQEGKADPIRFAQGMLFAALPVGNGAGRMTNLDLAVACLAPFALLDDLPISRCEKEEKMARQARRYKGRGKSWDYPTHHSFTPTLSGSLTTLLSVARAY